MPELSSFQEEWNSSPEKNDEMNLEEATNKYSTPEEVKEENKLQENKLQENKLQENISDSLENILWVLTSSDEVFYFLEWEYFTWESAEVFWDIIINEFPELIQLIKESVSSPSDVYYIVAYLWTVSTLASSLWAVWITTLPKNIWKFLIWLVWEERWRVILSKVSEISQRIPVSHEVWKEVVRRVWDVSKVSEKAKWVAEKTKSVYDLRNQAQKIQSTWNMLNSINRNVLLADIFTDKIMWTVDNELTTDFAMDIYYQEFLKDEKWIWMSLADEIERSRWEVKYNLIRVKERLIEVEMIFEKEIVPIVNDYINRIEQWIVGIAYKNNILRNLINKSELTKAIFTKIFMY